MTEVPDYIAPVQGWRLWLVVCRAESLQLASIVYDVSWPQGQPLEAQCLHRRRLGMRTWRKEQPRHAVPDSSCRCGIYAASNPFRLGAYLDSDFVRRRAVHLVVGRVSLWGTVIESERGWRASYAYPSHLYVPLVARANGPTADTITAELAAYGVPVEVVTETATPGLVGTLAAALAEMSQP